MKPTHYDGHFDTTLEIEGPRIARCERAVTVDYTAYPPELQTRDCPGCPAEAEIHAVTEIDGTHWENRLSKAQLASLQKMALDDASEKQEESDD